MLIRRPDDIKSSEITDEAVFLDRRRFMGTATGLAAASALAAAAPGLLLPRGASALAMDSAATGAVLPDVTDGPFSTDEEPTSYKDITRYNNFYEFGTGKEDPAQNATRFRTKPWSLRVDGEIAKPGDVPLETLLAPHTPEERVYRLRCVEAWSMTIPWSGFPLKDLVDFAKPLSGAKYVEFETFQDDKVAPGQRQFWYPWPYIEGLTLAEARNELAFIATGLYGKVMPKQNGAPLRLAAPWKYGFKSTKGIVLFEFTDQRPRSFWEDLAANEYGFWANVNPEVPHPRWSQASERVVGKDYRVATQLFNGYGQFVADLYRGLETERLFM